MKKCCFVLLFVMSCLTTTHLLAESDNYQPAFSIAGLYPVEQSGRIVSDFNVGWRFFRGDIPDAEKVNFDDSQWDVITTPHTVQLLPAEASGCRNYQGKAWYRKHFVVDASFSNKLIHIHFEAAMGKSTVFLNGQKVEEHLGGYLPFSVELTQYGVKPGDKCLIAVMADNSDDRDYPPGKKQATLDFTYHGGIYRDVWMIATDKVHITNPNKVNKVAGGGVFIQYGKIDKQSAEIFINTDVTNQSQKKQSVTLQTRIISPDGRVVKTLRTNGTIANGSDNTFKQKYTIQNPILWSPDAPLLYKVEILVLANGKALDGGMIRSGIRKLEFKGKEGFFLNGERYKKLIGGNRHQDFAYVGNAVPNSQHWKDAKKLKDAGFNIVRVAHYPQDPSFMDACDELGLFVIVATPGWQYWNRDPKFADLVHEDVRNMIRRDRNHTSVLMWEPILNETRFPLDFALKSQQIVQAEQPGGISAADHHSEGVADNYEVIFGWPTDVDADFKQPIFTREFGENVDDWYAHNNNNRASRSWGERPMLVQALSLATSYDEMCIPNPQFIGGAQWHPFDHQRGYHPDPYWGGMFDAFRQPKYAYYMFKSQVDADAAPIKNVEMGPMIHFAHEISPFSPADLVVFTNCDEVRLVVFEEEDTLVMKAPKAEYDMPHPPIVFKDVYDFFNMRKYSYTEKNWQRVSFQAEGLIDGKVVCTVKKMPSRRSTKLRLSIDNAGQKLIANGSDFIPVICEVTDDNGNVRRLAKDRIFFTIEGEGEIIGDATIGANPRDVEFGSAPVLIRSTLKAGKITVHARVLFEGEHAPTPASIEFESIAPTFPLVYKETPQVNQSQAPVFGGYTRQLTEEEKQNALIEVERQQTEFGVQ